MIHYHTPSEWTPTHSKKISDMICGEHYMFDKYVIAHIRRDDNDSILNKFLEYQIPVEHYSPFIHYIDTAFYILQSEEDMAFMKLVLT